MQDIRLADLFQWGPPSKEQGRTGPKIVRRAPLPSTFWRSFNSNKPGYLRAFKKAGVVLDMRNKVAECWTDDNSARELQAKAYAESFSTGEDHRLFSIADGCTAYPYQNAGTGWMIEHNGGILGDDMGLGKSLQLIQKCNETKSDLAILLVCPPSLRSNWRREIGKFGNRLAKIITLTGIKQPTKFEIKRINNRIDKAINKGQQIWVIIGDSSLVGWQEIIHGRQWNSLAVDEAHRFKNLESKRTKALVGHNGRFAKAKGVDADFKLAITGTPIQNRPSELVVPLLVTGHLDKFGGEKGFIDRYCKKDLRGNWSNTKELNKRLRGEGILMRRFKRDVQKQIPNKRYQSIILDDPKLILAEKEGLDATEVGKILNQIKAADPSNETLRRRLANDLSEAYKKSFGQIATLRRKAGIAKIPAGLAHLDSLMDQTSDQIIVATIHKAVTDAYLDHLAKKGIKAVTIRGGMTDAQKDEAEAAFQSGEARVLVGQIISCGVGLNLTAARIVFYHEADWTPGAMDQMDDRAYRIGQLYSVLIQHLVVEGGLDSHMSDLRDFKAEGIRSVLDDRLDTQAELQLRPKQDALETPLGIDLGILRPFSEKEKKEILGAIRVLRHRKKFRPNDQQYGMFLARKLKLTDQEARAGTKLIERHLKHIPEWPG